MIANNSKINKKINKMKGKIALFSILFSVLFFLLIFAVKATLTNIELIKPENNVWLNVSQPEFKFKAISKESFNFSCKLLIDETNYGMNESVLNNTETVIRANQSLSEGTHQWKINCSDSNSSLVSETRTIKIDLTKPSIVLTKPSDGYTTKSREIEFGFVATDNLDAVISCSLIVDDAVKENFDVANDTEKTITLELSRAVHEWYVSCVDEAGNKEESEKRTVTIEKINYCEEGEKGEKLRITVKQPDENDEFYPKESIDVEVEVENRYDESLDVVVEAALYDLSDDEIVVDSEKDFELDEDEERTVTLSLTVPANINEKHHYAVFVKAYEDGNEEEQCKEDEIGIEIKRKSHSLVFENVSLAEQKSSCGSTNKISIKLTNVGRHEEEIKLNVKSSQLFLDWSRLLTLDKGDSYTGEVIFTVPSNITEGNYSIVVEAYYEYEEGIYESVIRKYLTLEVKGNCLPLPYKDVSFSLEQVSEAFSGMEFTIKVTVKNTGNVKTNYTVDVKEFEEWATLQEISKKTLVLEPDQQEDIYVKLQAKEDVVGMHTLKVIIGFDNVMKEETLNVEVKKTTKPASSIQVASFIIKQNLLWFVLVILLALCVIVLSVFVVKQTKGRRELARKLKRMETRLKKKGSKK